MKHASVILFFVLILSWGCTDDSTNPETPDNPDEPELLLFKATFVNNWLSPDEKAVIFLSDNEGDILADTVWMGDGICEIFLDSALRKKTAGNLSNVNITIVRRDYIKTNLEIPVGSSWKFKGDPSPHDYGNPPYSVELDFENVPACKDNYLLSSKWSSKQSTSSNLGYVFSFNFYESPQDFYLKLNTVDNGVQYLWISDVEDGSRQVDLSNMNSASVKTISLPSNNGYRICLYGISGSNSRYEGQYFLDYGSDNNSTNSIDLYYPAQLFTDYCTSVIVSDEQYSKEWYSYIYGEIPNSLSKIDADFSYVNTSIDEFEITTSGDYLEICSRWDTENYAHPWLVYGDKDATHYNLPNLPDSVSELFDVERNSFQLSSCALFDYPELSSYSEIITTLYKSEEYFDDIINEFRRLTIYPQD